MDYREHVHKQGPRDTLGASILDFAQLLKSIHKWKKREGESKWIIKSIILGLNTSICLFELNQQKKKLLYMILIVNTANLFISVGHTLWSSWEKPGSASSTHFPACPVKDQHQVALMPFYLNSPTHLFTCLPSCLRISTLCVHFVFFQLHTIHQFEIIVLQSR